MARWHEWCLTWEEFWAISDLTSGTFIDWTALACVFVSHECPSLPSFAVFLLYWRSASLSVVGFFNVVLSETFEFLTVAVTYWEPTLVLFVSNNVVVFWVSPFAVWADAFLESLTFWLSWADFDVFIDWAVVSVWTG